jgi:hypothetical protein
MITPYDGANLAQLLANCRRATETAKDASTNSTDIGWIDEANVRETQQYCEAFYVILGRMPNLVEQSTMLTND